MTASDQIRPFYDHAHTLITDLPPATAVQFGPDLPPGSSDAEAGINPQGQVVLKCRSDYPSAAGDPAWRALEMENTFNHEIGHPQDALYTRAGRDHHARYWALRGFPTSWDEAETAALAMDAVRANTGWAFHPRESWAECFGAALSGRWTKPEKTMNWGRIIDPLAARAFFQSLAPTISAPIPPTSPPQQKEPVIEWQGPVPATNYAPGRSGNPVALVVDHWMGTPGLAAGTLFASSVARFMSPGAAVSAHYLISTTGRIVQLVRDEDTAYHAGDWNTNQLAIGIEHEANATMLPSDALYAASAWLHRKISQDHGIRLVVGDTVIPHRQVVATACPGTLDLDHIVALASMEEDMTPAQEAKLDRVIALLEAREPLVWIARSQRTLDVETGKTWNPNTLPIDPRIKT